MAVNTSKQLPQDRNNAVMVNSTPAFQALQATVRENGAASSVTSLNTGTTAVLVTTVGGPAAIKWAGNQNASVFASVGGMSYDATLATNESRLFVVPRSVAAIANWSGIQSPSMVGMNVAEGLFPGIATRLLGVGSVLLTEY
jgi:hypothetical protein